MVKPDKALKWVKLQISAENLAFAEAEWRKYGYFSRDDYLKRPAEYGIIAFAANAASGAKIIVAR